MEPERIIIIPLFRLRGRASSRPVLCVMTTDHYKRIIHLLSAAKGSRAPQVHRIEDIVNCFEDRGFFFFVAT